MVRKRDKYMVYSLLGLLAMYGLVSSKYNPASLVKKFFESPRFNFVLSSSGIDKPSVTFRDDLAPGMSGFIEYEGDEFKMACGSVSDDSASFCIPKGALAAGEFTVWAVDRHGNESRRKKLYVLEGIVTEKKPY